MIYSADHGPSSHSLKLADLLSRQTTATTPTYDPASIAIMVSASSNNDMFPFSCAHSSLSLLLRHVKKFYLPQPPGAHGIQEIGNEPLVLTRS